MAVTSDSSPAAPLIDPFVGIWEARQSIMKSTAALDEIRRWVVMIGTCAGVVAGTGAFRVAAGRSAASAVIVGPASAALAWSAVHFVASRESRVEIRRARRSIRHHERVLFDELDHGITTLPALPLV